MSKGIVQTLQSILLPGSAASAAVDSTSVVFDTGNALYASFHLAWGKPAGGAAAWSDLTTGTAINANFVVKSSNTKLAGVIVGWVAKAGASLNVTTANGWNMISLNGVATERYYAIFWDAGGVTGGTVACYAVTKG